LPPGEQAALADSIAIAARRAQELNRGLLEGSVPGTGPPATDVGGAVDQLAGLLRHLVPPGVGFTVTIDPDLPRARVEPFELDRLGRRRRGAVRVTSRPEGGSTLFEVLLPAV